MLVRDSDKQRSLKWVVAGAENMIQREPRGGLGILVILLDYFETTVSEDDLGLAFLVALGNLERVRYSSPGPSAGALPNETN